MWTKEGMRAVVEMWDSKTAEEIALELGTSKPSVVADED